MAIAPMLKVTAIAHASITDVTIDVLQTSGVVGVVSADYELPTIDIETKSKELAAIDEDIAKAKYIHDILLRYHTNEQPMAIFVSEKFHVDPDNYRTLKWTSTEDKLYSKCESSTATLAGIQTDLANCETFKETLTPWLACTTPFAGWRNTEQTTLIAGTADPEQAARLEKLTDDAGIVVDIEAYESEGITAIKARCLNGDVDTLRALLSVISFTPANFFEQLSLSPAQIYERVDVHADKVNVEHDELEALLTELSKANFASITVLIQALESARARITVREAFSTTEQTVIVTGWVRKSNANSLKQAAVSLGSDIDLTLSEPGPQDVVPVELDNPKWLRPFELMTDLYGRPAYGGIDPTLAIAPFFTLFFAICIGDVGYGLMLIATFIWIMNKLDVAPGVIKFCKLMIYGGAAAIPVGIAFGSYFALPFESLPQFMQNMQVLDPLNEITTFLLFTLVIGGVQIITGILIAAYDLIRRGDIKGAVASQISTLFLLSCIAAYVITGASYPILLAGGLIVTMLLQGNAIYKAFGSVEDRAWDRAIGVMWLLSALAWTLSFAISALAPWAMWGFFAITFVGLIVSRVTRKAVVAMLGGAYEVYGMTGILNDTLSYTRLAALGLSSSLVGMVFNILAGLVWGPVLGLWAGGGLGYFWAALVGVASVAVFCIGHVFNVTINLLGAFVHPMRLQFVEFFGKFYEAGGYSFVPFAYRSDSLVFISSAGGDTAQRESAE